MTRRSGAVNPRVGFALPWRSSKNLDGPTIGRTGSALPSGYACQEAAQDSDWEIEGEITKDYQRARLGDASTILPGVRGPLCASHPGACQALAGEAVRLGAELVCGVAEVRVQAGARPIGHIP